MKNEAVEARFNDMHNVLMAMRSNLQALGELCTLLLEMLEPFKEGEK